MVHGNNLKFGQMVDIDERNIFWKFDGNLTWWRHFMMSYVIFLYISLYRHHMTSQADVSKIMTSSMLFWYFLKVLRLLYNHAKFHPSSTIIMDFRQGVIPPPVIGGIKSPPIIGLRLYYLYRWGYSSLVLPFHYIWCQSLGSRMSARVPKFSHLE